MRSLGTNNTNQPAERRRNKVKIVAVIAHGSKAAKLVVNDALTLALEIAEPLQYRTQLAWRGCFKGREVLRAKRTELQLLASRRRREPDAWNSGDHGFDCRRRANGKRHTGLLDVVSEADLVWIRKVLRSEPVEDLTALGTCAWMEPHSQT